MSRVVENIGWGLCGLSIALLVISIPLALGGYPLIFFILASLALVLMVAGGVITLISRLPTPGDGG